MPDMLSSKSSKTKASRKVRSKVFPPERNTALERTFVANEASATMDTFNIWAPTNTEILQSLA
jgi:hypothetical protein